MLRALRPCRLFQLNASTSDHVFSSLHLLLRRLALTSLDGALVAQGLQLGLRYPTALLGGLDILQRRILGSRGQVSDPFALLVG